MVATAHVSAALAAPPQSVVPLLLDLPEDQWFDRKSNRVSPASLADLEVGFANADGGVIVVGLHNGLLEPATSASQRNALVQAAIDFTQPPVRTTHRLVPCRENAGEEAGLLVIDVPPSDQVHSNRKDEVFLRVGDENRRLTWTQRQELLFDKGQATYETTPLPDVGRDDLREDLLAAYASAVSHPDPYRLLRARGLVSRQGAPTVGAVLLFGTEPQTDLPGALVRVLRYRGTERGTGARQQLIHDLVCEGPIPDVLGAARQRIQALQPTRRALGRSGLFETVGIVPEDAWLEGLVNAVIHRSYSIAGDHIRVSIFDDRVEIESPGRFPGITSLDDPEETVRFARNPRIARVCADLDFGQELGEGIRRIFEEMRLAGLADPVYRQSAMTVRLTLSGVPVDRALEARLPTDARQVLGALRERDRLGTGDIADLLRVSRPVAIRRLKALRDEGLIGWSGTSARDPRAYWHLPTT